MRQKARRTTMVVVGVGTGFGFGFGVHGSALDPVLIRKHELFLANRGAHFIEKLCDVLAIRNCAAVALYENSERLSFMENIELGPGEVG
jgi:hypothetical protein